MIKKILILATFFFGFTSMAVYTANQSDKTETPTGAFEPVVVLELFTSQGCSSCPPADVLLNKVKESYAGQVFALSYHVDYWNYIGWEDPFSKPEFTKKQRQYGVKFKANSIYTPQMVVNGREHFVGSDARKLQGKIAQYGKEKVTNKIELGQIAQEGQKVAFEYKVAGDLSGRLLRAVLVLDEKTTMVKRGENRSRTLKNANIVVQEQYITLDKASGAAYIKRPAGISTKEKLHLILLVEDDNQDITAAVKSTLAP